MVIMVKKFNGNDLVPPTMVCLYTVQKAFAYDPEKPSARCDS